MIELLKLIAPIVSSILSVITLLGVLFNLHRWKITMEFKQKNDDDKFDAIREELKEQDKFNKKVSHDLIVLNNFKSTFENFIGTANKTMIDINLVLAEMKGEKKGSKEKDSVL